jgi:hypothetical protein
MAGTADIEAMVRNKLHSDLSRSLDSAVQVGDIQAARKATQQLQELALSTVKSTGKVPFSNEDIRSSLKTKAPWFGVDPRRSARAVEFGKNMEPQNFKDADAFADALIEAVADEFDPKEDEGDNEEDDGPEEKETEEKKRVARKKTDAPSGAGARAIPRRSSGPWSKLSDAPKEVADMIKASADKFTRNATKEQRQKYIETALGTAYSADQRAKGRK